MTTTTTVRTVHPAAQPLFDAVTALATYQPTSAADAAHLVRCLAGDWDQGTWSVVSELLDTAMGIANHRAVRDDAGPAATQRAAATIARVRDEYLDGPAGELTVAHACMALEHPRTIPTT